MELLLELCVSSLGGLFEATALAHPRVVLTLVGVAGLVAAWLWLV